MIRGCLEHAVLRPLAKFLVVGVLFLLFLPVYAVWFKPWRDLSYHLLSPPLERLEGPGFHGRINAFVEVEGRVRAGTFTERRGWVRPDGYLFQLEGYPDRLLVWVSRGPAFDALEGGPTAETVVLRGRLYDNRGWVEAFQTYADRDEVNAEGFARTHHTPLDAGWWLLVVGEEPGPSQLADTQVPVFCVGMTLGLLAIGGFLLVRLVPDEEDDEGMAPADTLGLGVPDEVFLMVLELYDPELSDRDLAELVTDHTGEDPDEEALFRWRLALEEDA